MFLAPVYHGVSKYHEFINGFPLLEPVRDMCDVPRHRKIPWGKTILDKTPNDLVLAGLVKVKWPT